MRMTDGPMAAGAAPADVPDDGLRQQLLLAAWFSPAFPIGGFAFSHGLEWAAEAGLVSDRVTLEGWIGDLLTLGSGRADTIVLAESWRAACRRDAAGLAGVAALAAALQPSRERHLEATVQGAAFLDMAGAATPQHALASLAPPRDLLTLPVVAGLAGAVHSIALVPLAAAALAAFAAGLVSASVRLGIVGQTDGQRITAALGPVVIATATSATRLTLDDLAGATFRADLACLQHETQYSRLFRS